MFWYAEAKEEADFAYLPVIKTDITIRLGDRTIVADTKYYGSISKLAEVNQKFGQLTCFNCPHISRMSTKKNLTKKFLEY